MFEFQRGRATATIRAKYPSTNTPPARNFHPFFVSVVWLKSAARQAKMRHDDRDSALHLGRQNPRT